MTYHPEDRYMRGNKPRKHSYCGLRMAIAGIVGLTMAAIAGIAKADHDKLPIGSWVETVVTTNHAYCHTVEEVHIYALAYTAIEEGTPEDEVVLPTQCFSPVVERPVLMTVYEHFENDGTIYVIVRLDMPPFMGFVDGVMYLLEGGTGYSVLIVYTHSTPV